MQDILLKPEYSDEQVMRLRKEVIQKVESMQDNYILQALLNNFRRTGDPRFFNLMVECLKDVEELERRFEVAQMH
ncbi:MAG: hypothetical protein Q8N79_08000 [Candidatus Methanoperedens sp.]|nr:hypothetical protein [Candidatus Methanoperedens sp.]